MKLYRLYASEHQLVYDMMSYVAGARPPTPKDVTCGNADVAADIDKRQDATTPDRPRPLVTRHQQLYTPPTPWMPKGARLASFNYFPPGGSGQGWHTDTHKPAWRIYMGRPLGAPGRFVTLDEMVVDEPGMAVMFNVTGNAMDSWHAIWAPDERFSVGVTLTVELAAQIIAQLGS